MDEQMTPRISVVVPAYNAQETIGKCLDCLQGQDYDKDQYEIIVVNDGSTDNTVEIIERYEVMLHSQQNQGPAAARNMGAQLARGEIILFTDSDCSPNPQWLSEMVTPFEDPEIVAVKGAYITDSKTLISKLAQLEFEERYIMLTKAGKTDMIDTYSAGVRRDAFLALDGFDTSFPTANNEDTEFSYRLAELGKKMVFNGKAIVSHEHAESFRDYCRTKFYRGYWRMVVYRNFRSKMMQDTYTPQTLKLQILLAWLLFPTLLSALIFPSFGLSGIGILVFFFIISALPLITLSQRIKGPSFISVLGFLYLRALSIGAGVLYFFVKGDARVSQTTN